MKIVKVSWVFEFSPRARAEFKKLDKTIQKRVQAFINKMIQSDQKPTDCGKQLSGKLSHLHSFRVGDYRILGEIKDKQFKVLAVGIGHRKDIYKKF